MATQEKEKRRKAETGAAGAKKENEASASSAASNELRLPIWSVISFEKREAGSLTYAQAEEKLAELEAQKVSGLCIVTDEVAARISKN